MGDVDYDERMRRAENAVGRMVQAARLSKVVPRWPTRRERHSKRAVWEERNEPVRVRRKS